ncbi:MAG: prepilin-type N-terminal cleavage/methylation domain-containing protein [Puniceicoccales bacterium]
MKKPLDTRYPAPAIRRGFTLTELLVVMAVILVLLTILIPAASKIREKANASKCTSNLRQIGVLFHSYALDNDGYLPYTVSRETMRSWDYALLLYAVSEEEALAVGNAQELPHEAFSCPSASKIARGTMSASSYAANLNLLGLFTSAMDSEPGNVRLGNVEHPSQTYLAADCDEREFAHYSRPNFEQQRYRDVSAIQRHNGAINMLFADGSVQPLTLDDIPWGNTSSRNKAPWGPN